MSQVRVDFIGDYSDLKRKTEAAERQLERLKKKVKFQSNAMNRAFKNIAVGATLWQLGNYAIHAAKGMEQAQIASKKLAAVMSSMGVEKATKRVDAYAESLETLVWVDADVIKATQTKLATFEELNKTINKTGGNFDRATVAALDMAAAGFGTAEGNAVQLGKALNDPIKGINSLTRSGITFTAKEKKRLKILVETNKVQAAQSLILKAIEKQVGGTSKASVSAFDKMKLSVNKINDEVGKALLPLFEQLAAWFAANGPTIAKFIQDMFDPNSKAGKAMAQFGKKVGDILSKLEEFFRQFDPSKKDGVTGFFTVLNNSVNALLDVLTAVVDLLNGSPGGLALASGKGAGISAPTVSAIDAGITKGAGIAAGGSNMSTLGSSNYNIYLNKANTSAQDIIREIQRYERQTGKKYLAK